MMFQMIAKCDICGREQVKVLEPDDLVTLQLPQPFCSEGHESKVMKKLRFERVEADHNG